MSPREEVRLLTGDERMRVMRGTCFPCAKEATFNWRRCPEHEAPELSPNDGKGAHIEGGCACPETEPHRQDCPTLAGEAPAQTPVPGVDWAQVEIIKNEWQEGAISIPLQTRIDLQTLLSAIDALRAQVEEAKKVADAEHRGATYARTLLTDAHRDAEKWKARLVDLNDKLIGMARKLGLTKAILHVADIETAIGAQLRAARQDIQDRMDAGIEREVQFTAQLRDAVKKEREGCAKVLEAAVTEIDQDTETGRILADSLTEAADAIRARSEAEDG